jgi:DNA-binding response OmpR family regulator
MMGHTVLIIDDDADLLQLAGLIFKKAGAQVITACDALDGISKFFTHHPDLVILDIMMPGNNGFDICQRIRQVSQAPLIFLTALNQEHEMLRGLAAGADDFLSKPFNPEILLARARSVLRRVQRANKSNGSNAGNGYHVSNELNGDQAGENSNGQYGSDGNGRKDSFSYYDGYLSIDVERHEVLIDGKRVKLTPIEFRLLAYLARNGGKLLTFDRILANVWGDQYQGSMEYVHVYVSHLRRKIEPDPAKPSYILTVHREGYIFEKQELRYQL